MTELDFPRSWVDEFVDATAAKFSPTLFRKWQGIMTIAGALERKVWVRTMQENLYPNLYCFLCGPPGVGKSQILDVGRDMLLALKTHHLAKSSVTKASLVDDLAEAVRNFIRINEVPPVVEFNSLFLSSSELGVLIPSYDSEFMQTLTHLYDGKYYGETRRTHKIKHEINAPNINIIGGCTPGYLRDVIPALAWSQGFLSRVLIIYSGETEKRSLFAESEADAEIMKSLQSRLKLMSELYGQMQFEESAAELIDNWQLGQCEPLPSHPRLTHYNTRRPAHLLKLSMIAAVATGSKNVIEKIHIQLAMDWLFEAEFFMADIFKAMAAGGDSQVIEDTFHHLYTLFMKEGKKPIGGHRLIHFLQERTPAHNIMRIMEIMERSKMIEQRLVPGLGTAYVPLQLKQL